MTPDRIGRYEIQRRLGTGGMGSLYLARDPSLDRLVAIKLLREDYRDEPELRERFIREARSVARLRHPNIVIVHDVGEDDGRPFMAMEYIAGETLTHVLRRTPSVSIAERLALFEALCAGLAHAHAAGIVHRDIKPANIMLDSDGVLKILDFGIARVGNSGITQDGMMMGTVNYMSPEQVVGRGVDHRTDIFSAGTVLYEMVALEQAFPGGVDAGVLHRILNEGAVPLEQRVPGVDSELASIVRRALEREPLRRYQDANEMRLDVERVRRRLLEEAAAGTAAPQGTTVVDPSKPRSSGPGLKADSDRPRRLTPERLAQLRRQQVEEHLRYSEEAFARGDHDAALHHAERAATVDPDSRAASELIDRARFAIEAKAIRQLLGEAERMLADGNLDDAAALADEASVTLPDIDESAGLRREVQQAIEKIAAAREREQRITESLQRAKASMERGGYDTALRAVYEVLALDPDRPEAHELERTAKQRLQAQRELEQAQRSAYDRLTHARALADSGKFDEAVEIIQAVTPPSETVRIAAEDALSAVRTRQRQVAHAGIVAEAREALQAGHIEQALVSLDVIPLDERSEEARSVQAAAEEALRRRREHERKRLALEAAIAVVNELIAAGDLAKAFQRLEDAARLGIDDERIPALRQQIADLGVAAQLKRQQEARDRLIAKRIEAARQLLAEGNGYAAIALLERAGADHPRIEETLREIRDAVAEQEERVRQEAERRRQEEEARRRAEIEAARKLEEQRRAEEQRRRHDEERRVREAELRRRRDAVTALLEEAERALEADRPDEAIRALDAATRDSEALHDPALRRRAEAARADAARRQKRRHDIDAYVSRARARLAQGSPEDAREAVRAALALDGQNAAALKVLADADEEVRRREAEAKRRAEARRQEEEARRREEDARQREAALVEILTRARQVETDEAALTLLNEALALAPADSRVQAHIAERKASLKRRKAAEEQQRLEERRRLEDARRREEEARRLAEEARKRDAAVADLIGRATEVRDHDAALTLLRQAETMAPGDSRLRTLISERSAALDAYRAAERLAKEAAQRERERDRVRQQIDAQIVRARELLGRGDLASARQVVDEALALDAHHLDAQRLLVEIADETKRRVEEEQKREEEIATLIDQARQVPEHDAALTLLRQAATLVPGDPRLRTLILERSAALDAQRAAERAAQEAAQLERERLAQQERDAAAATVVEKARRISAEGRHADALALLRGSAPHPSFGSVIVELDSRRVEIERERAREARRRRRQQRQVAVVAMLQRGITDRRVHVTAAVLVLLALAVTTWRFWPTPEQTAFLPGTPGAVAPPPSPPGPDTVTLPPSSSVTPPPGPGPGPTPPITPPPVSPKPSTVTPLPPAPSGPRDPTSVSPIREPVPPTPAPAMPEAPPSAPVSPSSPPPGPVPVPPPTPPPSATPVTPPGSAVPSQPERPPQAADVTAERTAIQQLLDQWVAAYNRMDEARLRAIDPTFGGIRSRPLLRSVELALTGVTIDVSSDGQSAVAQATQNFTYEWNRAGFPPRSTGTLRWRLQKKATTWVVVPGS